MAPRCESPDQLTDGQAGVSLVEIVVAMFLFAVMSVAILPLMIGAVKVSVSNRDLVAANSLANGKLASLQSTFPNSARKTCDELDVQTDILNAERRGSIFAIVTHGRCLSVTGSPSSVTVTVQAFGPNNVTNAVITLESAVLVSLP